MFLTFDPGFIRDRGGGIRAKGHKIYESDDCKLNIYGCRLTPYFIKPKDFPKYSTINRYERMKISQINFLHKKQKKKFLRI
jgi:hypothetical protein